MVEFSEADWLGDDNPIVRRTQAAERATSQQQDPKLNEMRVIGPPGCGKTSFVARQATIAAEQYGHDSVLLASLTKTAAQELAGRDTPIPARMIGTLHAHCYRALDRPELAEIPDGIREWNTYVQDHGLLPLWRMESGSSASDLDHAPAEQQGGRSEGEQLRNVMGNLRARCTPVDLWPERVQAFHQHWTQFKQEANRQDFTDLIEQCLAGQVKPPGSPAVMMLDEAQDMSLLEMRLARMWGTHCERLVICGDPAQALFSWRGSDPEALFDGPCKSETVLEQSYRVPAAVHQYAVNWIRRMPGYHEFAYKPTPETGSVQRLTRHPWVTPAGLLDLIEQDVGQGRSVMVLATCGYMLAPLIATLRRHGMPFHNPYRPTRGDWNPMRGADRLLSFLRPDPNTWGDETRMWTFGDLHKWIEPLQAKGLLERGIKASLEAKNMTDRFGESRENTEAPAGQVAGMFTHEADASCAFDLDVAWWQSKHLARTSPASQFACSVYEKHGGKTLRANPQLIVGTVHSLKGSEADSVYLWPDVSQAAYSTEWTNKLRQAPLYRTFYVGMTRAREKLTLLPPSGGTYVRLPIPEGS